MIEFINQINQKNNQSIKKQTEIELIFRNDPAKKFGMTIAALFSLWDGTHLFE